MGDNITNDTSERSQQIHSQKFKNTPREGFYQSCLKLWNWVKFQTHLLWKYTQEHSLKFTYTPREGPFQNLELSEDLSRFFFSGGGGLTW